MNILLSNKLTKKSQPVTDIETQVKPYIQEMAELCRKEINGMKGEAIAHCQVEADNPLTFYVRANGDTIVNPVIISVKEKTAMWHTEGCLSFPHLARIPVKRYRIIKAKYTLITPNGVQECEKNITDMYAYIMQHEMDHFNLKSIYDEKA